MRVCGTMFAPSPLLLMNFGSAQCRLETPGTAHCRVYLTTGHLDFPKLGGFGQTFQDAGGELLEASLRTVQGPSLPPMGRKAEDNKGDSR